MGDASTDSTEASLECVYTSLFTLFYYCKYMYLLIKCGNNHNFDAEIRPRKLRLDTGTDRRILGVDPRRPDLVHRIALSDVRQPDLRPQQLRFIGAGLGEARIYAVEDLSGLALNVSREGKPFRCGSQRRSSACRCLDGKWPC